MTINEGIYTSIYMYTYMYIIISILICRLVNRVRSAHLSPGLPMGFTRVNPGWALSLILKKWVLSGSSLFLMFTFVYFTVI